MSMAKRDRARRGNARRFSPYEHFITVRRALEWFDDPCDPAACVTVLAAPYAVPGAGATELNLGLYVLGVPVADAVLGIDLSSAAYRVGLRYHTTGLVDLVNSDSLDARVRGNFERDLPAPFDYAASADCVDRIAVSL